MAVFIQRCGKLIKPYNLTLKDYVLTIKRTSNAPSPSFIYSAFIQTCEMLVFIENMCR